MSTPGRVFHPAQAAGASTSRTKGRSPTVSRRMSVRRSARPTVRFFHARPSPPAKRSAARASSHTLYQTSASPPRPST